MDKTIDAWPRRAFYLVIAILMTLGLLLAPATTSQANAAEVNAEWDKVATPTTDDGKILPGSDFNTMGTSIGGKVVYVVGTGPDLDDLDDDDNKAEIVNQMWKSEDSGATWKAITKAVFDVVDDEGLGNATEFCDTTNSSLDYVIVPGDDASGEFVAVAATVNGTAYVFVSVDGGGKFAWPGALTSDDSNIRILTMAISGDIDGKRNIAVGGIANYTADPTTWEALLYRLETGGLWGSWKDATLSTSYPGWDITTGNLSITSTAVTDIKFSPSWTADKTVLVVSHTGNVTAGATYLQTGIWSTNKNWNNAAGLDYAVQVVADPSILAMLVAVVGTDPTSAVSGLALPMDYEKDNRILWVYVDVTNATIADPSFESDRHGIIFRVEDDVSVPIIMQISGRPLLATFSYLGYIDEGKAIAGLLGDGTLASLANGTPCCEGIQVYRNDGIADMSICCDRWSKACKPPTGNKAALVAYVAPNKAYALVKGTGAAGDESAFSVSFTDGDTWNQLGLVDTNVNYLSDVAESPNCNKTWVVSVNNETGEFCYCDSVWLKADPLPEASEYSGAWIRVWCKELSGSDEEGLLRLAPEETEEALTVYLVDRGTRTVYWDTTEGIGCWEKGSVAPFDISDLAVANAETIYAVGFNGYVAKSDDYADDWAEKVDTDLSTGHTIAVTPTTGTATADILVGGANGDVAYSADGGEAFTELEDGLPEIGDVHVVFDSYFDTNSVVYAAVGQATPSNATANGIYRWIIDDSTSWTDLGECAGTATPTEAQLGYSPASCTPVEVGYYGIVISNAEGNPETDATTGGVLYATFYDAAGNVTGVARCLNPAEEVACGEALWDYLIQDTADNHGAFTLEPSSLKICGCLSADTNSKLWAIDDHYYYDNNLVDPSTANSTVGRLWTYEDCYAKSAPTLGLPLDGAVVDADPCYCWNDAFTLKWERQCDACSYNLLIAYDEDFTEVLISKSGKYKDIAPYDCTERDYDPSSGSNPSYVVKNKELGDGSCGTTFYWKVRSADAETGEIIHSPWSEVRSFTVAAGPMAQVTLTNPSNGAIGVVVSNIPFTWDAVPDATSYEFSLVNAETDAEVVSATSVSAVTYTYTGALSYDTSYYWTVKALKDTMVFSEATATFTTGAEGVVPTPAATPAWVWVIIAIGAVLVIVTLVLIFRTRRV